MSEKLNDKQALQALNNLTEIHNCLMEGNEKTAFFRMGQWTEELAEIIRKADKR